MSSVQQKNYKAYQKARKNTVQREKQSLEQDRYDTDFGII